MAPNIRSAECRGSAANALLGRPTDWPAPVPLEDRRCRGQPLPVVRRHLRADIDQVHLLPRLEHVHVLAYRCRRLLLGVRVDDEKDAYSEQLRMREFVPFPEDLRQIAGSSPRRSLHRNAQGVVNIALEFLEFGLHLRLRNNGYAR